MSTALLYILAAAILTVAVIALRLVTRNGLLGAAIELRPAISESGDFLVPASESGARILPAKGVSETGPPE